MQLTERGRQVNGLWTCSRHTFRIYFVFLLYVYWLFLPFTFDVTCMNGNQNSIMLRTLKKNSRNCWRCKADINVTDKTPAASCRTGMPPFFARGSSFFSDSGSTNVSFITIFIFRFVFPRIFGTRAPLDVSSVPPLWPISALPFTSSSSSSPPSLLIALLLFTASLTFTCFSFMFLFRLFSYKNIRVRKHENMHKLVLSTITDFELSFCSCW